MMICVPISILSINVIVNDPILVRIIGWFVNGKLRAAICVSILRPMLCQLPSPHLHVLRIYASVNKVVIGSENDLSLIWRLVNIWTNASLLLILDFIEQFSIKYELKIEYNEGILLIKYFRLYKWIRKSRLQNVDQFASAQVCNQVIYGIPNTTIPERKCDTWSNICPKLR